MAWNQKRFWYTCISRRGCVGEGLAGASKQGLAGLQGKARRGRGAAAGVQSVSPGDWKCWAEQFRWQGGGVGGGQCEEDNDNDNKEGGEGLLQGCSQSPGLSAGLRTHCVEIFITVLHMWRWRKAKQMQGCSQSVQVTGSAGLGTHLKMEKSKTNAVMCACYQQQSEPDRQMHFFELSIFSEEKIFTLLSMSCLL